MLSGTPALHAQSLPPERDLVVYRPSNGTWYIRSAASNYASENAYGWGMPTDIPLQGDFDGDGRTDLTVYRPSTGEWWIRYSSSGYAISSYEVYYWGSTGDVPLVADFDGDGRSDITVFRPSTGSWFIRYSGQGYSTSAIGSFGWGSTGDVPRVGDFDGDGKSEITVYRPSTGDWWMLKSGSGYAWAGYSWGASGDRPIVGDYDGDGKQDVTVYRPSTGQWFMRYSSTGFSASAFGSFQWGAGDDDPIAGDINGDGRTDLLVHSPTTGQWQVKLTTTFAEQTHGPFGVYADVALSPARTVTTVPQMWVDTPAAGSTTFSAFTMAGWAVDIASGTGTGVDGIAVWAAPVGNLNASAWGSAAYGAPRADIAYAFGERFRNSGWSLAPPVPPVRELLRDGLCAQRGDERLEPRAHVPAHPWGGQADP